MKKFAEYIDSCFDMQTDTDDMYKYKKDLLNKMIDTANDLQRKGLEDEKVIYDLTVSEFPNPTDGYKQFEAKLINKRKSKKRHLLNSLGSVLFILLLTAVYLIYSFASHNWVHSWLIMEGGITFLIIYHFMRITSFMSKKRLYPVARIFVAFSVMLTAVFAFLVCRTQFYIMNSYLIFLGAVGFMFIADAVFAAVTKQKFAIINYLLYVPTVAAMLYVILGLLNAIPWHPGWFIMIASVVLDILIIIFAIVRNKNYDAGEVDDQWKEN